MSGFTVPAFDFFYQGLPASGGSLNVYQTGTTTPVTIYSDGGLTIPLSNPLPLDANGQAKFYYSGTVNLRLDAYTSSGALIQSIDPVYPTGAASGAGIPWVAAGGTADVITATYSPVITALTDGLLLGFRATAANATTTPTFSPNALLAHTITQKGGSALVAGSIAAANAEYLVQYDLANTRWELLNPSSGGGNGAVLLSTQVASNAASVAFTTGIDSTYAHYRIEITDLLPVTDNIDLQAQIFQSGAYYTASHYRGASFGNAYNITLTGTEFLDIGHITFSGSNTQYNLSSTEPVNVFIDFCNPSASTVPTIQWNMFGAFKTSGNGTMWGGGGISPGVSDGAWTGIKFFPSSGNFSGTFKLYGVP